MDTLQHCTGPHRSRAARFEGCQESSLCKGFRPRGRVVEGTNRRLFGMAERFMNLQREDRLSGCWNEVIGTQYVCREPFHLRYRIGHGFVTF